MSVTSYKMLIDGERVDAASGKTFDVYDPATEAVIATCPAAAPGDVDRAVKAAQRAFYEGGWRRRERAGARPDAVPAGRADPPAPPSELAELETINSGKPIVESEYDMDDTATCFEYYGGLATKINGEVLPVPADAVAFAMREPMGVAGQIIPWNYPLLMAAWKIAPALAAGCTVVHQARRADAAHPARAGRGLRGGRAAAGRGQRRHRRRAAAPARRWSPIRDVRQDRLHRQRRGRQAHHAERGRYSSSGSRSSWAASRRTSSSPTPTSRTRWTARCSARSSTRARCARRAAGCWCRRTSTRSSSTPWRRRPRRIKLGPGLDRDTKMGPLVSAEQRDRVAELSSRSAAARPRWLRAAARPSSSTRAGTSSRRSSTTSTTRAKIAQEEIFGPVMSVIPFKDEADAIRIANATPYGLAAAVWTRDIFKALPRGQGARGGHRLGEPHAADVRRGALGRVQACAASAASSGTGASRSTSRPSRCTSISTRSRSGGTDAWRAAAGPRTSPAATS